MITTVEETARMTIDDEPFISRLVICLEGEPALAARLLYVLSLVTNTVSTTWYDI